MLGRHDQFLQSQRIGFDATSVLTVYLCLLLAIPSAMVVGPLGSAGAPSNIMAIGLLFWWAWFHTQRNRALTVGAQPVRVAMLGWLIAMVVVYAHAMLSPIPFDEISPADSGMLKLLGMAGLLLVANDGIPSLARNRVILQRMVIAAGLVAVFGLLQYLTKQLFIDRIQIPGLTSGAFDRGLIVRSGFARPSGTSTHPIEYGVVLTMILPLAITVARKPPSHPWMYRGFLCAITFAVFLSISRSAILCAIVGLLVLALTWSNAERLRALAFVTIVGTVVYLSVPGMLGAVTGLFTGVAEDASIASRTGSYDIAAHFISTSPILGRGFGTFQPKYWILDNGYLGLLIEGGIVGLAGLIVLIATAVLAAKRARRAAVNEFDRDLAQAIIASIAAGASGLAFFDTFGFPQSAGCFFLLLGLAGSTRRLALADASTMQTVQRVTSGTSLRFWPATQGLRSHHTRTDRQLPSVTNTGRS